MNIKLADFQIKAIGSLMETMLDNNKEVVLKSCTGSGKTIILTHFMDEYFKSYPKQVFIWLTPGKGSLEEQSKEKMDRYIHGSQTKLLYDVMTSGFSDNDACFINWEKLTKKGNTALKDSERANFLDHIQKAHDDGLSFNIIVDESHQNNTIKADDIIEYFDTRKIIRCSATPKDVGKATLIEIPEEDVIAEGLIKKMIVINENFDQNISVDSQINYLINKALEKQIDLSRAFSQKGAKVNPLIIIQIPNKSDLLLEQVEQYLYSKHITYENMEMAVWLSKKKENLDDLSENTAKPKVVIIKQAIATGWDCPRAHILVKLRDNMNETFEIQTIGRIRRMPEVKHYESDLLDSCYLYTLDEKFTEGVKQTIGGAEAKTVFLKKEFRNMKLVKEQKTDVPLPRDAKTALNSIFKYYIDTYSLGSKTKENKIRLETVGYNFATEINTHTYSGETSVLKSNSVKSMNTITITEEMDTHAKGHLFHNRVGQLGVKLSLSYDKMVVVLRKLFDKKSTYSKKILMLETRETYAFVINNFDLLKEDIRKAMASVLAQTQIEVDTISEKEFTIPPECIFTYNAQSKVQKEMYKNVYKAYLSSAAPRSTSEKKFEQYCEDCSNVNWLYKNGDKGEEYLSIVYQDSLGKQKSFYPDYIISVDSEVWVIETKGGFDRAGRSEDIDLFSPRKFEVLKEYTKKHRLNGGFVREDKESMQLCICMDNYSDNISSDDWNVLSDVF